MIYNATFEKKLLEIFKYVDWYTVATRTVTRLKSQMIQY